MRHGSPELVVYEYRRCGVADLFVAFEPLGSIQPEEARRIAEKPELHHTPIHASWLNMAEIGIGVLSRQCLAESVSAIDEMRRKVSAWQCRRNAERSTVNWRFPTADARSKLKKLYPAIS